MMTRRRLKWFVVLVFGATLVFAFRKPAEKYFDIAKSLDIFATLFKEVNTYYVDEVEPQKLIRVGINGMLESLDPYTDYIPEDEMEAFRITTTGQYGGVGALIGIINDKTVITHPYRNFPAYKAGLRVGDELVAINGTVLKTRSTTDVSMLLKGQPKTEVEVRVKRPGQKDELAFKIRRDRISVSNVAYVGLVQPGVGYIKLDDFTPGASREVADAVVKLKEQGARSLIIDVRDNPGGLLHEAVNIVGHFIPKGREVVSTKGKVDEWNKSYTTLNNPVDTDIPLVVLTSEGSASASEIVAGALQDYDRAVLIGKKTFGKGLVQTTRPLSYNSQLKVTTAKYYTPSGRCIQAMDYTHRKADGTVVRVADSLKSEFKTRHGRKVFDGGGLDPDVDVDEDNYATVTIALINSGLVFEYASRYCGENPTAPELSTFTLSDKEYEQFVAWTKTQKFTYATALERDTRTLIESAKREKYYSELEGQLTALQSKVESNKATDLVRFKKEIVSALVAQIAFHYDLEEGHARVSLKDDLTVREACRVLSAPTEYSHILSSN
jgi:carboxyl-terminal processing protease